MFRKFTATVLLLSALSLAASAQRTARNSWFASVYGATSFTSWGVGAEGGQYSIIGYWDAGANFIDRGIQSQKGTPYSYTSVVGYGDYNFRIWATRNRMFNGYAGIGMFFGAELYDVFGKLPEDEPLAVSTNFLCGIQPKVTMELFFIEKMAAVLMFTLPINFCSQVQAVNYDLSLGVRYNF